MNDNLDYQIIRKNKKEYYIINGVKHLLYNDKLYKVLTKEEFMDKVTKDLKVKEFFRIDSEEIPMSKGLKLISIKYEGVNNIYTIKEEGNGCNSILISSSLDNSELYIPNKQMLETLINELTQVRNNI